MAWYRRVGDRRGRLRFEIVGQAWGALETIESLPLRNIGGGGALVEAPVPFSPGSAQSARLMLDDHVSDVRVRIRHVRAGSEGRSPRYLTGLEFVDVPRATQGEIDRVVEAGQGRPPSGQPSPADAG